MKKLIGIIFWISLSLGLSQALVLEFINLNLSSLMDRFTEAHFMGSGNDFGGAIFRLPTKSLAFPKEIALSWWDTRDCRRYVRGMYYNSQRGERIRPLDVYTLETFKEVNSHYEQLNISGWRYTTCDDWYNFNIYGQLNYNRSWTESRTTAWLMVNYTWNNFYQEFSENFEYFNNEFPLGYIVDSVWWVAFVGGLFSWHECLICQLNNNCTDPSCGTSCSGDSISELFELSGDFIIPQPTCNFWFSWEAITGSISDIQRWINIQWNIGLSRSIQKENRETLLWNFEQKIAVINSPNFTASTLINDVKKNTQSICRGRKNYANISIPTGLSDNILCLTYDNYSEGNQTTIDLNNNIDRLKFLNKTLIIKNWNLVLENSLRDQDGYLDIFIDKGNIYIEKWNINLQNFNEEWYPASTWIVAQGLFLKGNIITNGLLLSKEWTEKTWYNHKLYIHGKLNTLNTPLAPSEWRTTQIEDLFNSTIYEDRINLQNIFTRTCNPITGSGSDNTSCFLDPLADSNIIIIWNQKYPSNLF